MKSSPITNYNLRTLSYKLNSNRDKELPNIYIEKEFLYKSMRVATNWLAEHYSNHIF